MARSTLWLRHITAPRKLGVYSLLRLFSPPRWNCIKMNDILLSSLIKIPCPASNRHPLRIHLYFFETESNWKLLALKNAIKPELSYLKEERSRFYENALLSWTPNSIILRLPLSSYQFTEGMLLSHSWRAIVNDSWIKLKCFSFGILGQNHSILICKIAGASFIFKLKMELSSPPRKFPGNPQTWSGH